MIAITTNADTLVESLVTLDSGRGVALLDSCGVGHLGSHLMIAGIDPVETLAISDTDPPNVLDRFSNRLDRGLAAVFTISYNFGNKLNQIDSAPTRRSQEPDIYIALFDSLFVHDYTTNRTFLTGKTERSFKSILNKRLSKRDRPIVRRPEIRSNFSRTDYIAAVDAVKEYIRDGYTYQTNLTQQITALFKKHVQPGEIFLRLRRDHPAPFSSFIDRGDSQVVSASPERFFDVRGRTVTTSPIKGTRARGGNEIEHERSRNELLDSEKDRAENTMIVDLLRNDLGRVCEFGSVTVEKLCDIEEHPTLFHLVSTVRGELRSNAAFIDVLSALFPCGSITGAPKISTMQIIDELEPSERGLSMGAIGYFIPNDGFEGLEPGFDLSVAIRTMVFRGEAAEFNVGGGITIESDPEDEYQESMLKAKALLAALGNNS